MPSSLLLAHVAIGTLALISGGIALGTIKGSRLHKFCGKIFAVSMCITTAVGTYIAVLKPELVTAISGALTFYLILTSWAALSAKCQGKWIYWIFALMAYALGSMACLGGLEAMSVEGGLKDDFPAGPYFAFGGLSIFACLLDISCIVKAKLSRRQRLTRHIWRMCTALLIASSAVLLGQIYIFPAAIRSEALLSMPLIIIAAGMVYYIFRVRRTEMP